MELLADRLAEVQAHVRSLGWIGGDEPILALECPGAGNMNRTLRARLPRRSLILKQAVPHVARYPQIPAPVRRLEAEAAFYRAIAGHETLCRHTAALLGEDTREHLLCLEDLGEAGDLTRLYAEGPGAEAAAVLPLLASWLGTLHDLSPDPAAVPDNADMRRLNHAHIFQVPFDPDNGVALSAALRDRQARLAADARLRHRAAALGDIYLGSAAHASRPALLHGDYYPGSWLQRPDGSVAVIDPEFAFIGAAEFDVGVLAAHLRLAGFADAAIARVLDGYSAPPGFDVELARDFAAVEVLRRLLGVAQLPLGADDATRCGWLDWAHGVLAA